MFKVIKSTFVAFCHEICMMSFWIYVRQSPWKNSVKDEAREAEVYEHLAFGTLGSSWELWYEARMGNA